MRQTIVASIAGFDRPDPRNLQADNRNDPADNIAITTAVDYRGNSIETLRSAATSGPDFATPRYGNANSDYPPATNQGNPLMPSSNTWANANYHDASIPEPGVARFRWYDRPPPVRYEL